MFEPIRYLIALALVVVSGCDRALQTSNRVATQQSEPDESTLSPVNPTADSSSQNTTTTKQKKRITADDAIEIVTKRFGHSESPGQAPSARLVACNEGYQRARDNVRGDPEQQGPVAFGSFEDLDRDGQCWFVQARYGSWLVVGYLDEFGEPIHSYCLGQ